MHELIVVDAVTGWELCRRGMLPSERYELYAACFEHDVVTVGAQQWRAASGLWRGREQDFELKVVAVKGEGEYDA